MKRERGNLMETCQDRENFLSLVATLFQRQTCKVFEKNVMN